MNKARITIVILSILSCVLLISCAYQTNRIDVKEEEHSNLYTEIPSTMLGECGWDVTDSKYNIVEGKVVDNTITSNFFMNMQINMVTIILAGEEQERSIRMVFDMEQTRIFSSYQSHLATIRGDYVQFVGEWYPVIEDIGENRTSYYNILRCFYYRQIYR